MGCVMAIRFIHEHQITFQSFEQCLLIHILIFIVIIMQHIWLCDDHRIVEDTRAFSLNRRKG